jgi:L,D-transpeptidase YcbB
MVIQQPLNAVERPPHRGGQAAYTQMGLRNAKYMTALAMYSSSPVKRRSAIDGRTALLRTFLCLFIGAFCMLPPRQAARAADTDPQDMALSRALNDAVHTVLPGPAVAHETQQLQTVYTRQDDHLLWSGHHRLSRQGNELVDILLSAEAYGLEPGDYGAAVLASERTQLSTAASSSDEEWARFDLLLTRAAIRMITHLHYGRVEPRLAGFELQQPRHDLDVAAAATAVAVAASVPATLALVEPHFYHYGLLKAALARYRTLAADPSLTRLPAIPRHPLRAGDLYPGTPQLRKLLTALGDLAPSRPPSPPDDHTLDSALVAALTRFQNRHGLAADGVLGPRTYAALTTPLTQRVRQIVLTLERWRWLPPFTTPPIIVNIPEFRLFAFRTTQDRVADILQMPVIVGETYPRTRTPVFVGDIRYVVFRPYWDIPRSIALREMLPQIRAHADYLQHNHLEIVRGQSDDAAVMAPTAQTIAALAAGRLRLRQRPGDDNALGLVKFVFPNAHNVYMHGTPAHELFLQSRRAFSHGCIRVSDPVALASYVLRNAAGNWDMQHILAAMHASQSSRVELRVPVRVMILYGTAMATEAGPIQFFDDIYGQDRKLETLLGLRAIELHRSNDTPSHPQNYL